MKIYIDGELPKECFDCPCFRNDIEICCGLDDGIKDYHNFVEDSTCPLETTQSLKQQVREEVVKDFYDEIRHRAILEDDYCPDHNLERKYGLRKCVLEDIRTTILKKYGGEDE